MQALARRGFATEVLCGTRLSLGQETDLVAWLAERGLACEPDLGGSWMPDGSGVLSPAPVHYRLNHRGVAVLMHHAGTTRPGLPRDDEGRDFLHLYRMTLDRERPDLLIGHGGDSLMRAVFAEARSRGIATLFPLHNFLYDDPAPFDDVDAVLVPSQFAADYYREALGLECTVIPNLVDLNRIRVEPHEPKYLTFVNPSVEKGVYPFARIADELGKRRPDIPILVVEGRGTEANVAACGLDLRRHGNVPFMAHTHDPRRFWRLTKIALVPSLWWESQGLVAVEAMTNGIPVVASDRGALPETLGGAGVVLPLPERLTTATRWTPTVEEVLPWVEAILQLWDDRDIYQDQSRRAFDAAKRWAPEVLESEYAAFLEGLSPGQKTRASKPLRRARAVVLVPHLSGIVPECEAALRVLEREGIRVRRREGSSQIDVARNELLSEALHDNMEAMLFIDADIGFDPLDALRLLARPEPVVAGIYAKKGRRELASRFADEILEVRLGVGASGLYPLKYAATGFLRVKASSLRRMIAELDLPLCNTRWGRGSWPFFWPAIVSQGAGSWHYLGEDWAFSHRLGLIGVTPLADTSIRLWHYGRHGFGWEEAGMDLARHRSFTYRINDPGHDSPS